MKANRTGEGNNPPTIEDLKDGTFYYNFGIKKTFLKSESSNDVYPEWHYSQVRLAYPVDKESIQNEVDRNGFKHKVKL